MNDKFFTRKNIYNPAEEYSDNFGVEDDEFTDETITSDDIRMIGSNKPSNPVGNNYGMYNQSPFNNATKAAEIPGTKYDVNNPSYRISGGFNSLNKPNTLGNSDHKSSTMYGGFYSMNNNSNKAYDPYSNININQNYSSAGFKSDRDKYNINIDIKKYDEKDNKEGKKLDSANLNLGNTKNKNKDTNFNYNYNLNNYSSNLNYTNIKKDEININSTNNVNNEKNDKASKKKKKDFFDDLDNQLKKDKFNDDYNDDFGIQLQNRENDHINIKSGEDDSDDLKEITNINKELESISNSKDLNEGSTRIKKPKYVDNTSNKLNKFKNDFQVSEEENNIASKDSSVNENLFNLKKKQNEKNNLKLKNNESEEEDYGKDNSDNYDENEFDDELNSYKNSLLKKSEITVSQKTPKMETNEDYRDSTISINAYVENEKKSDNKNMNSNLDYEENEKNKMKKNQIDKNTKSLDIDITESNDIDNNFSSSIKSKSKKDEYDYDKLTLSQSNSKEINRQTFNPNSDFNKKLNVYDPSKMEEYLRKSQGMNLNNSDLDEIKENNNIDNLKINNKSSNNDNKFNNINVASSKDLSKNKNQNEFSSYNYSQELFMSQEKKSDRIGNYSNKDHDIESEYNHFDDFDSNLESIPNDSMPYKIATSVSNTNRENQINLKENNHSKGNLLKNSKNESDRNTEDNYLKNDILKPITEKETKIIENIEKQSKNYNANNNPATTINNSNSKNFAIGNNIIINNKTIEEKSEKSSDILDSKENEKYFNENLYYDTGEFNKLNSQISKNNKNSNNLNNNNNSEALIKEIIAKEMSKYINDNNLNKVKNISQLNRNIPVNQLYIDNNDNTNVSKARSEILNKFIMIERTNNFLLHDDNSKIKIIKKADKFFKLSTSHSNDFTLYGNGLSRKDIREMKLDTALTEERKKREFFEFNFNRQKELIEDLENKIKKLKSVEIENSEIKKSNIELENKYSELEKDLKNIKNEYDYKMKLIEDRVTNRELKNESRKITDIKTKFEIEIDNLQLELKEKENEIAYLKDKIAIVEQEKNKLSINKLTAIESNEKIRELQNENFIIHEKLNIVQDGKFMLEKEKEKLEKQLELLHIDLMQKQLQLDESKNLIGNKEIVNNEKNVLSSNNKYNENNKNEISTSKNFITHPENFFKSENSLLYYYNNNNIFEQIYQEREINTHEILIQSYLKEIQNLQNEIKLLKSINNVNKNTTTAFNFNPINEPSDKNFNLENSYINNAIKDQSELDEIDSHINISQNIPPTNNEKDSKKNNIKKNNYLKNKNINSNNYKNSKSTPNKNSIRGNNNTNNAFKNNSILKQCAEEKIKKLSMLLNHKIQFDSEQENKINYDRMRAFTEEIKLRDKSKSGELELETYLNILIDIIKIEMNKYDLIEIFNNFYKCGPNLIKSSDLINALVNNEPSAFFIQSDPGYLMQIEKKILEYEKQIIEKQNAVNDLNTKLNRYQEKFMNIENENKEIKTKCELLEKEKQSNQLVFNEIMKSNFLRNSGMNFSKEFILKTNLLPFLIMVCYNLLILSESWKLLQYFCKQI